VSVKNQAFESITEEGESTALRILMADGDPQEHILMAMVSEGISTPIVFDFVSDGSKLLTELDVPAAASELPNLIILDLKMSGLDGYHTLEALQSHPLFWQVPVIVFSSSSRLEDEFLSYDRGADLFQTKTSSFSAMEAFLRRAISVAKSADEYIEIDATAILDLTESVDLKEE